MRIVKGIVVFFGTFMLYHIVFSNFFPVDENNVLQAPDAYIYVGTAVAIIASVFSTRKKKTGNSKKSFLQRKLIELREKSEYDNLSESEKWKLEREAKNKTHPKKKITVDKLTDSAAKVIFETGIVSVSILQRRLNLGYARAASLIDDLEKIGVVGQFMGSKPRKILLSEKEYLENVVVIEQQEEPVRINPYSGIDIPQILKDEYEWRRLQKGLSEADFELSRIDTMEWREFEYWCADLLEKNGFTNVEVTAGSRDQGVDVLAQKDGIRYAVQCKCYSHDLGNKPVQEVNTGKTIYHCQIGAVMTNRYFTKGAKEAASATGVLLWDRDKLIQMMDYSRI